MQDDEIDQESIIGFMTFNCQAARLKWNVCRERISMEVYMVVCSRTCDFLGNKLGRSATERSSPLCNRLEPIAGSTLQPLSRTSFLL